MIVLAVTDTATFEGLQAQIVAAMAPIVIVTLGAIFLMVRTWVEAKTASFKAHALKAKAEAAVALANAEAAKVEAERIRKTAEALAKGVESIKDVQVKDVAKEAVKTFSKITGQFENVDKLIVDLGLSTSRSKAEIKSPAGE